MFCSKCGMENKEGSKFCEACGAQLEEVAAKPEAQAYTPEYEAEPQQPQAPIYTPEYEAAHEQPQAPIYTQGYGAAHEQPQAPMYAPGYGQPPKPNIISDIKESATSIVAEVKGVTKQTYMKVISVMLAVLTIATMLMGWTKIASDDIPVDIDVSTTFNVFQFTNVNGMIGDALELAEDMSGMSGVDEMSKEFDKIDTRSTITSIIMVFAMIAIGISLILLFAYIFLSLINSKNAIFVGRLSCVATVLSVILFIIAFMVFHSILSVGNNQMDKMVDKFVTLRLTVPVFLTLFAAVGNFVLMLLKKDEIKA